ncbi:hypothetical protein JCM11251_005136 [Rhodosporidiobolus azoricus]
MFGSAARRATRRVPFPLAEDEFEASSSASAAIATLPSGHFLAQRPVTPPQPESVISNSRLSDTDIDADAWAEGARPDTSTLSAADYDVSVSTGFMPPEEPVQSLSGLAGGWEVVEACLEAAQEEAKAIPGGGVGKLSERWRESVRALPGVSTQSLTTLPLLRRAHTLLAHVMHFYMHSTFPSQTVVPAPVAVPLVAVSDRLGMPPILTYADTVLWVWKLTDKALGLRADNVEITTTFTSTPSERAFFLLSLFCELHGPAILRLMSSTLDEAFFADEVALRRISAHLFALCPLIDELSNIMAGAVKGGFGPEAREKIVPEEFYWEIRPWFNGGKWVYEGIGPYREDQEMEWGGPSAGQSSLVHAIDLFLGVDHNPRSTSRSDFPDTFVEKRGTPSSTSLPTPAPALVKPSPAVTSASAPPTKEATFMLRMMHYMPAHHRSFLHHLSSLHLANPLAPSAPILPSVRELAQRHPAQLGEAYDLAVSTMKRFRDVHIRLVVHFIVAQAKTEPPQNSPHWAGWEERRVAKEREEEEKRLRGEVVEKGVMKGTGGTDLSTFLKRCRDRTAEAVLRSAQQQKQ